jgi:hypothetical protein
MAAVLCPLRRQCCGMEKQVMATPFLPPPFLSFTSLSSPSLTFSWCIRCRRTGAAPKGSAPSLRTPTERSTPLPRLVALKYYWIHRTTLCCAVQYSAVQYSALQATAHTTMVRYTKPSRSSS